MTIDISNNDPRISYAVAQGVTQTSFAVPFEFFDDSDVNVYVDGTLKTITTDYTISGGGGSTGTVTISVTGATGGSVVVLTRDITIERTTDFTAGADINRAALNTQLDTLTAIAADVKDRAGLALSYNDRTVGVPTELPDVAALKGNTLAFNASTGAPEAGPTIGEISNAGTFATNASNSATAAAGSASAAAGSASSASGSASAAASSASAASTSASNAATSASNASTSATNAANSASAASTSETNAASSASAASTSASNAATSETNAGNSASAAATSASNASTSETNAANSASAAAGSATSAANSAAAAATALDNFDDRYLGVKASDPTLDNDGDPLVAGALYFSSTQNIMKVYDGSSWIAATSAGNVSLLQYEYTATLGQTTFSGADDNSATLSYTVNNLIVTLNGVVLDNGGDYTATSGTSVVLTSGAAAGDLLQVIAFKSFTVADMVPASTGGTFAGNVTTTGSLTAASASITGNLTVDTNTLFVDAANNRLGIGTSSPDVFSRGESVTVGIQGTSTAALGVNAASGSEAAIYVGAGGVRSGQLIGGADFLFLNAGASNYLSFGTNFAERMRIDASGDLLVGTTSNTGGRQIIAFDNSGQSGTRYYHNSTAYNGEVLSFLRADGTTKMGSVYCDGGSTQYFTTSDYRLKENVVPLTSAADRLAQIPVYRFNFISNPDKTVDGFLAHEAQAVVPECASGFKDEVDAEGNPVHQGIDQSKLVPLLTAALQEALARIETLEADVAALKGEPA